MKSKLLLKAWLLVPVCSVALVMGCGGGTEWGAPTKRTDGEIFGSNLTAALAAIASNAKNYSAFINLLDGTYKQDGITRANLAAILAADAAALPDEVSFAKVSYTDGVIGNCSNSTKICDLTVTATNADADAVSIKLTMKVIQTSDGYMLVGDQSAS